MPVADAPTVEWTATPLAAPMYLLKACFLSLYALILAAVGTRAADSAGSLLASAAGVYNSSVTPSDLPWNTYNYCNAPHVNAKHYAMPANVSHAQLVYLNAVIRHHKVRPPARPPRLSQCLVDMTR